MTSILELNDLGKKFLRDELAANYFACTFDLAYFYKLANKNIANDKNYVELKSHETRFSREYRIEFTKDHLKFKDKE